MPSAFLYKRTSIVVLGIGVLLTGMAGYAMTRSFPGSGKPVQLSFPQSIVAGSSPQVSTNLIDLSKVKVGDRIGALTVTSISPYFEGDPLRPFNATITFSGRLTLTGHHSYFSVENISGEQIYRGDICIDQLDQESLKRLPWLNDGEGNGWFCLTNTEFAQTFFPSVEQEGRATIIVDHYTINSYSNGAALHTAELVDVIKTVPSSP